MSWELVTYTPQHTPESQRIYLQARQLAFPWIDPITFSLPDFDAATQGESLLVAIHQNKPVGFIAWWPPDNFIHSLFIDPVFVGQGIGKALLRACLEQIGRPATLKCLQANEKALGFYYAQGWVIKATGESPDGPYFLLVLE